MSYIDEKYALMLSPRLSLFKSIKNKVWNFRCPLCGDSKKSEFKARGYLYYQKDVFFFKCHNCIAMPFSAFLKRMDANLYDEYKLENFREYGSDKVQKRQKKQTKKSESYRKEYEDLCLLDKVFDKIYDLEPDHKAIEYLNSRKIPIEQWNRIYYIDDIRDFELLKEKYRRLYDCKKYKESRIVFPLYNLRGQLSAVIMRSLVPDDSMRYINVKIIEDDLMLFGIDEIDSKKRIYCVEGPVDSLFIKNSIAVCGTSFNKLNHIDENHDVVYIFDNQPRNKDVCKLIEKKIEHNESVKIVIWPERLIEKDINDMVLSDLNYMDIINENIYSGLRAKMQFNKWKKC